MMVVVVVTPAPDQPPVVKPKDDEMSDPTPLVVLIEIKLGGLLVSARVKPKTLPSHAPSPKISP